MEEEKEINEGNNSEKLEKIERLLRNQKADVDFLMGGFEDLKLRKERFLSEFEKLESMRANLEEEIGHLKNQLERKIEETTEKTLEINNQIEEQYTREIQMKLEEAEKEINGMKSRKIIIPFIGIMLVLTVINIILVFLT